MILSCTDTQTRQQKRRMATDELSDKNQAASSGAMRLNDPPNAQSLTHLAHLRCFGCIVLLLLTIALGSLQAKLNSDRDEKRQKEE